MHRPKKTKPMLRYILSFGIVLAFYHAQTLKAAELDAAKIALSKHDYPNAITLLKVAANQGVAEAQAILGTLYYDGIGVRYDDQEAYKWNLMAAKQGRPDAEYRLALAYDQPQSTIGRSPIPPWDKDEANHWFHKAVADASSCAEKGDSICEDTLGELYYFGAGGLPRDLGLAFDWIAKAADHGVPDAQFRLGSFYTKDLEKARVWYLKASEAGHAGAETNLAILLSNSGDKAGAELWFRKAAALGNSAAIFYLERDYGIIVSQD